MSIFAMFVVVLSFFFVLVLGILAMVYGERNPGHKQVDDVDENRDDAIRALRRDLMDLEGYSRLTNSLGRTSKRDDLQ